MKLVILHLISCLTYEHECIKLLLMIKVVDNDALSVVTPQHKCDVIVLTTT